VAPQTHEKSNFLTLIDFDKAMALQPNYRNCMAGSNVCYTRNLPKGVKPADFIGLVKKLYIQNNITKSDAKITKRKSPKIPAILHQIWFGEKPIPPLYKTWQQQWLKMHPNWTLMKWTEKKIQKDFPKGLYNQKTFDLAKKANNFARMSDVVRYELLNKYGGLYIDYDVKCLSSFDPLHYAYDFYAGLESFGSSGYCCNAVIGATPSHPIIQTCVEGIKSYENKEPDLKLWPYETQAEKETLVTFITTGPTMLTRAIWHAANKDGSADIILPQVYFFPNKPTPISLCFHGFHSTWINILDEQEKSSS